MTTPHGIYPMLYAFFQSDGSLDREAMRAQANAMIAAGAHGIAVLGLITEVSKLETRERRSIIEWCVEDVAQRVPLAVTVAGETPEEQIDLGRFASEAGADWLVLQPPRESSLSELDLIRFYDRIMATLPITIGIQNAPEFLGLGLSPYGVRQLQRQNENFSVMKGEGPVYQVRRFIDSVEGKVAIFNGRGGLELPDNLRAGCAGMIPAPDCADIQIKIYNHFRSGEFERADALYREVLPVIVFAMQSIDFAISYGKLLTARRLGDNICALARPPYLAIDEIGEMLLENHANALPKSFLD